MAIHRLMVRRFPGIKFVKLLGTGKGKTFNLNDADLTRWGLLVTIDRTNLDLLDNSKTIRQWRKIATSEFRVLLEPISAHGKWSKQTPFSYEINSLNGTELKTLNNENTEIAAITRARIKWRQNLVFWRSVPPVTSSLHNSDGLINAIGIGEAPIGLQGTFSIWRDQSALRQFAYKDAPHQKVIARTKELNWYAEELFARFKVLEKRGVL